MVSYTANTKHEDRLHKQVYCRCTHDDTQTRRRQQMLCGFRDQMDTVVSEGDRLVVVDSRMLEQVWLQPSVPESLYAQTSSETFLHTAMICFLFRKT